MSSSQAGDRIEQDHHVALVLDQALGLGDHHIGNLDVSTRGFVEGRRNHLGLYRAPHVGHFLGALVDQQHDEIRLGMILGDRIGDVLENHRLACLGRRGDERTLSLPDRSDQVDDARGHTAGLGFENEFFFGVERRQVVEQDLVLGVLGRLEVDLFDLEQGEVALALLGRSDLTVDRVAGLEIEASHLRRRHVDIVRSSQVVLVRRSQEPEAILQNLQHTLGEDLTMFGRLGLEDRKQQVGLAHAGCVFDLALLGENGEFLCGQKLQLLDVDLLLAVVLG